MKVVLKEQLLGAILADELELRRADPSGCAMVGKMVSVKAATMDEEKVVRLVVRWV